MNAAALTLAALLTWWSGGDELAPAVAAQVARLEGHKVSIAADNSSFAIEDVAGEGRPVVGVIARTDAVTLALRTQDGRQIPLLGPLARPRIAGPGYKVWVIGDQTSAGALYVRRLGVLAPPWKR